MRLANPLETRVRVYTPEEVTSTAGGSPESDPRGVGLRPEDVDAIWSGAVRLYRTGLHPAIALHLRRGGQVVLDRAIGHVRGNAPGAHRMAERIQATPRTLFNLFSATKLVTAMLIHLLDERRLVHLDDPVAHYLPEFARHGKDWVTLRHVLTHRAGIPTITSSLSDIELVQDPARIMELIYDTRPVSRPGRRLAYHALTGGYVLGAIIERVTGMDTRAFLEREIETPLGFEHFTYGVRAGSMARVAENAFTGSPLVPPASTLLRRALGIDFRDAVTASNDPRFLTAIIPAGNIVTTAAQAASFMQLLLDGGARGQTRIFEPRTIQRAVAEQSYLEMDLTLGAPVRYGMGFMLGSDHVSIFGRHSAHAYGHLGFTNVVLYADPERDICVSLMTSGKPFFAPGLLRWLGLLQRIAKRCPRDWGRG